MKEIVAEHWSKVEAVASVLLEEKTLQGQCLEVICCSIEEGLDWRQELATYRRLRYGEEWKRGVDPEEE